MSARLPSLLLLVAAQAACRPSRPAPADAGSTSSASLTIAPPVGDEAAGNVIDLTEPFRRGGIDVRGPVVDLGEEQAAAFLSGGQRLRAETLNGDSWASVTGRVRLRVPIDPTGLVDLTADPIEPPDAVRFRVRHANARSVALIVDGLLVRTALLPPFPQTAVVTLPVPPERFRQAMSEVELRFPTRGLPGGAMPVSAEVDWVHVARGAAVVTRVNDLLNDVGVERTPRRALTFFPPTTLSTFEVVPRGAVFRAAVAAEAPRGSSRAPAPAALRLRVEADGVAAVERRVEVVPNAPWQEVTLDLGPLAGRPARFSLSALPAPPPPPPAEAGADAGVQGPPEVRLAVASPRIELPTPTPSAQRQEVRHIVLVVLRGARLDRFAPQRDARLNGGGFARVMEGVGAFECAAPAAREWSALVSALTGLGPDVHRVVDPAETLAADAPRALSLLAEVGVRVRVFSDERAVLETGALRDTQAQSCPDDAAQCRPEAVFAAAADALPANARGRSVTVVISRAGVLPLDPANDNITRIDPAPYEGTMTPAQTGVILGRIRRGEVRLDPRDQERLGLLYDASLLGVDRALDGLLDRVHERGLDASTLVMVVGDRGTALGDARVVQDGPLALRAVGSTVLLARGPGIDPVRLRGVTLTAMDPVVTALDVFGVERPAALEGRSILRPELLSDRSVPVLTTVRGDLGLRFGDLLATPRPAALGGGVALLVPADDPLGQNDVVAARPVARLFAELALARARASEQRRGYQPTRTTPEAPR
jgi:hypothetical protein